MLMLLVAAVVVAVGAMIFWSNPGRTVNRVAFTCSLHMAGWLVPLYLAVSSAGAVFWLRTACAVSAWVPFHYWLVKESITGTFEATLKSWLRRCWLWILLSTALAWSCYTDAFIPSYSTPALRIRGWAYYTYIIAVFGLYSYVFWDAYRSLKGMVGVRRLELQVWLGGGSAMAVTILALMGLNTLTHDRIFILLQPLVMLIFFAGMVVAISTYRIFDARQLVIIGLEKTILVATVAAVAYGIDSVLRLILMEPIAFLVTTALSLWFAVTLNSWLDQYFQFYPEANAVRQAAFRAAQQETRIDNLESAFRSVLQGWSQSDRALILFGNKDALLGSGIELRANSIVVQVMRQLRWITPERLARERTTPTRKEVAEFINNEKLGALVIAEGPALTVLVGVGVGASRRPFTYPQVTQLMELASIMEGALERAHFSAKAQHTEQLATVGLLGASLAHEIRNPLVTIKTFVQLLPKHHQDAAFREKFFRLIGDEVGRIDQLTDQLLDLASPRTYEAKMVELHPVLKASMELVAAKAAHRSIQLLTDLRAAPDRIFTDAAAAKQVMLNLCFNAIQAVESLDAGDRWVKISTDNTGGGVEMAVSDSGRGIAPEIQSRLFEPFQTTRASGFGLGLAICSDILANLNASITADPPVPGKGATFRVIFPCQPLSS